MSLGYGEVKISNPVHHFNMPSSSSPRRQSYLSRSYKTPSVSYGSSTSSYSRSSQLRATSLDRSSIREPASCYRPSDSLISNSSLKYGSGFTRSLLHSQTSCSRALDSSSKYDRSDLLSRISSLNAGGSLKTYTPLKTIDSLSDCTSSMGSPLLTNYKELGSGNAYLSDSRRYERRASNTNSTSSGRASYGSLSSLPETSLANERDAPSPLKSSLCCAGSGSSNSLSSATKSSLDENSNRHSSSLRTTRYDANHNMLPKYPASGEEKSSPSSLHVPLHLRQHSSSSSPASSTDDVSDYAAHRMHRSSGLTGTSSGYGSNDSASPSSSSVGGHRHSSKESLSRAGLIGLRNLGNTCFMNSVLQCLSNTKPLLDYCLKDFYLNEINTTISSMKGALFKAFASLLQSLWKGGSNETAVNPQAFKNQIQKFAPRFMGYSQQDAQEFLRYLLQGLHEDINTVTSKPKPITTDIDDSLSDNQKATESWRRYLRLDNSRIVDLFVGQLKSTLHCTVCGHDSITFDPFWDLSLPIPKAAGTVKIQQCFDLFTKEEILDGDEKPTCSKCKMRRKCTKSLTIHKFPKILVIHLKRFSPLERYRSKLSTHVDFSAVGLDLSPYAPSISRSPACTYNLYAVSNHSGTIYSGHYTAYCKHPYSGEWHDFNDSKVSSISSGSLVSSEAYVLFYELANQSSHL